MADFEMKANDTLPLFTAALHLDDVEQTIPDLTDATVTFVMSKAPGVPAKVNAPAVVVDPVGGVVRYEWLPADTDEAGDWVCEWEVTFLGGRKRTFPTQTYHTITIFPDLDAG